MDRGHFSASASLQRQWAEEVRHLHSLWHLGPPRNPNPNPSTNPIPVPNLRPNQTAVFKKPFNKKIKKSNDNSRINAADRNPETARKEQEKEWPVGPTVPPLSETSDWGNFAPAPAREPKLPSADEIAHSAAVRIQSSVLKASHDFFSKIDDSGSEDENDDEEEDEVEEEYFKFFIEVFERDHEVREYYEKNNEKGEFYCLVCEGTGMKKGKKFLNCTALVQHAHSVSKMKRKIAHQAYAMAVCRVLGWDFKRLPTIVLDTGKRLGESLSKGAETEVGVGKDVMQDGANKEDNYLMHENAEKGAERLGETEDSVKDDVILSEAGKEYQIQDDSRNDGGKIGQSLTEDAKSEDDTGKDAEKLEPSIKDAKSVVDTEDVDHHTMQDGIEKQDNAMLEGVEQVGDGKETIMNQQQILEKDNCGQLHILGHNIEDIKVETSQGSNPLVPEITTTITLTMDGNENKVIPDQQKDLFCTMMQATEGSQSDMQL